MKKLLVSFILLLAGFSVPQLLRAQTPAMPDDKQAIQPRKRGGVFTLYAIDPLSRNLCFTDGKEGMAFVNNKWENRCSDLSYTLAGNGSLVSGIELNRTAAIVDLGTPNDLRGRYGYDDAENGGVGFASLRLDGDKVMVLRDNSDPVKVTWQPLKEAPQLEEVKSSANAPIKLGHIYLVRIAGSRDKSVQLTVKLMVIAYRLDEAVTLRWELL
ncbi:MAG TPA: hypothetical protein VHS05_04720 [Pyrinomonadaceae bacterium]|jgi:hypothetical protein|nr:hypothetical protein [Pyrinomonadaceae bacterium]